MDHSGFLASAFLTLLLLPIAISPWEKWRIPDGLYLTIGLAGAGYATMREGLSGGLIAIVIGLSCLVLVAAAIGWLTSHFKVRLLLGSHIKLLGAGATWLSATDAAIMTLLAFSLFVFWAIFIRMQSKPKLRPEFSPIAVLSILIVQIHHAILTII